MMLALLVGFLLSLLRNLPPLEVFWEPMDRFLGTITR